MVWTPIKATDPVTSRSVHISIFDAHLFKSGVWSFEDLWQLYNSHENSHEEPERIQTMNAEEFYNYLVENFNLDGTACRLVKNIMTYIESLGLTDIEESHRHLMLLLDCAFGLTIAEIKMSDFRKGGKSIG